MPKPKIVIHREWFRTIKVGGRKSCPNCKVKLEAGESIWQWGNYVNAKWHNVLPVGFCKACYNESVRQPLIKHAKACGCKIELVGYQGVRLPAWLTIPAAKDLS
jgi:hypothetical protein